MAVVDPDRSEPNGSPPTREAVAPLPTIVSRFESRVKEQPGRPALRYRDGDGWAAISWRDYGAAVSELAAGLIELGIGPGDRIGLLSSNRPEWHFADLAILSVGAITVPLYPTSSSSQIRWVLEDSGATCCFVDTSSQLAKVLLHREQLPQLDRLIGLTPFPGFDRDSVMLDLPHLRSLGRKRLTTDQEVVGRRVAELGPDDVATLVYTSGTTGSPKGVMLSHGNIAWTTAAMDQMLKLGPSDRFLSYLPLSHIAERIASHFGQIVSGGETWFAQSLGTVPDDLRACRPTIFLAVPRVWEKFHHAIEAEIAAKPGPVRRLIERYVALGHEVVNTHRQGPKASSAVRLAHRGLDRTVGNRLRGNIGLDQARFVVSSAAPIHPDLVTWFHAIGIPIAEVWGQTEDCGPATVNPPNAICVGSVGQALAGLEVRTATDGELMVRGPSVCVGYWDRPDATAELVDHDGWMGSGDLGTIDPKGYVFLTGRKKDIIINSAGKNISPAEIETRLAFEALIGQAVVVGDGRRYLVALLTLDPDQAGAWAERHGWFADLEGLIGNQALEDEINTEVERVNREHAPVEQIKSWRLLRDGLTIERDELTPTLKVKRQTVIERNAELIDEMYAEI